MTATDRPAPHATPPAAPAPVSGRVRVDFGRNFSTAAPVTPHQHEHEHEPPPPSRLDAHIALGVAVFATWWLSGLIAIPFFDGNRLALVHVVFAALGVPLCGYLWWVAVRTLRAAR